MKRLFPALVTMAALAAGCKSTTTEEYSIQFSENASVGDSTVLDTRLKQLERLAKEYPKRADYLYQIAGIYNQKEDLRSAAKALERAIAIEPNEAKYHYHLGRIYLQMRELDLAETAFRRSLELTPSDRFTGAHGALGYVLCQKGKWREAQAEFETCVRIDPKGPEAFYYLGCIHDVLRERDQAVLNLKEYLRLGGSQYRKNAARILSMYGEAAPDLEGEGQPMPASGKDAAAEAVPAGASKEAAAKDGAPGAGGAAPGLEGAGAGLGEFPPDGPEGAAK